MSTALDLFSQVDVIYTDFSKAFDRLGHGVILQKLSSFDLVMDFITFLESYVADREQFAQSFGVRSFKFSVE